MRDDATVVNDGFVAYRALAEERATLTIKFDPQNNPNPMKWLHKAISNAKSFLLGTYHGIKGKHLQAYLSEYTYRSDGTSSTRPAVQAPALRSGTGRRVILDNIL